MSTPIAAVNNNEQQFNKASEKKTSASVFNNPRAMESSTIDTDKSLEETRKKQTKEEIEKDIKKLSSSYGISEGRLYQFLENCLGLKKEEILNFDANKYTELTAFIETTLEQLFNTANKEEELLVIEKDIKVLVANGNTTKEIAEFFEKYRNADLLTILKVHLRGVLEEISYDENGNKIVEFKNILKDEEFRNKLINAKSLDEFDEQEFTQLMSVFLYRNSDNLDKIGGIKLLTNILDVTLKDENLKDENGNTLTGKEKGKLFSRLYKAFTQEYNEYTREEVTEKDLMLTFLKRCEGRVEEANAFLDNEKIAKLYSFETKVLRQLLIELQISLPEENGEKNQLLVNKIRDFINPIRTDYANALAKAPEERTIEDNDVIKYYEGIRDNINWGSAFVLIFGTNDTAKEQYKSIESLNIANEKENVFVNAYKASLTMPKEANIDPVKITEKINEITDNAYSQTLIELGYEPITAENVEELIAKAESGELFNNNESSTASSNGIGYSQISSQAVVDNASANLNFLSSQLFGETKEQIDFIIDKSQEQTTTTQTTQPELFNKLNLSKYSGGELSHFISEGALSFIEAANQYMTNLSESGKDYIDSRIKSKGKGLQTFILNSINDNAAWNIMEKGNLFKKGLKVKFDYNREKRLEERQA